MRVCPGNAGRWSFAFGGRVSIGVQLAGSAGALAVLGVPLELCAAGALQAASEVATQADAQRARADGGEC